MARAQAGEPFYDFKQLQVFVYELRTDGKLTSPFGLLAFLRALIPDQAEH